MNLAARESKSSMCTQCAFERESHVPICGDGCHSSSLCVWQTHRKMMARCDFFCPMRRVAFLGHTIVQESGSARAAHHRALSPFAYLLKYHFISFFTPMCQFLHKPHTRLSTDQTPRQTTHRSCLIK
jgi:hypothetical protein